MATGVLPSAREQTRAQQVGAGARIAAWTPYVLALFFSLWALKGVTRSDVIDTDAARHAMNGAFIYDLVRTGHIQHPGEYGMRYYGRLPALSMPYHPPIFPLIEAGFFAIFGVKVWTARLAVAVAVAICTVLLYRLILATFRSHAIAVCATVTILSLTTVQLVARDVMLEFPAMMFVLAALYTIRDVDRDLSTGRALLFAVLSAAAVWTKQHAVFLAAMPIMCALLSGRPRQLLRKPIWISLVVFGASVAGLLFLSLHFNGAGLDQVGTTPRGIKWNLLINVRYYAGWFADNALGLPGIFVACSTGVYLWAVIRCGWQKLGVNLYLAWMILVAGLLLVTTGSIRYFFFLYPPAIVIAYAMLFRGGSVLWGERRAWYLPAALAAAWFVTGLRFQPEFLRGPGEAATAVVNGTPERILYAGEADGNFIFAVRSLDPNLRATVISAEKLPAETFQPAELERFCHQFGIDWVVLEEGAVQRKWSGLRTDLVASMKLDRSIPLESNRTRWHGGKIDVYRFITPAGHPGGTLEFPVPKIHRSIGLKL